MVIAVRRPRSSRPSAGTAATPNEHPLPGAAARKRRGSPTSAAGRWTRSGSPGRKRDSNDPLDDEGRHPHSPGGEQRRAPPRASAAGPHLRHRAAAVSLMSSASTPPAVDVSNSPGWLNLNARARHPRIPAEVQGRASALMCAAGEAPTTSQRPVRKPFTVRQPPEQAPQTDVSGKPGQAILAMPPTAPHVSVPPCEPHCIDVKGEQS